jgi:SAM-dependent methyltransferase
LHDTEIKDLVRARYGSIAASATSSCCSGPSTPDLEGKARNMGYSAEELAAVPDGANLGLGCGNPQAIAAMQPGEVVIDLGSGAGFDCLLAGRQVGPTGRVIGVDMTHEMLAKARDNAARLQAGNVEFRLGELEHLPVADNTADVIISNCVVNLVPDKAQVFREAFRVLKPGGRVAISDVLNIAPLPEDLRADPALLCGCVAGAIPADRVDALLREAGFADVTITVKEESREMVASWAPGRGIEKCVASAIVEARKPLPGEATACCAPSCCG